MASIPIKVPSVGESISEGILARWLKPDGGSVQAEEPLFELETDKASSVVPSPSSGVLKIGVAAGETVPIGATIGTIDPAGTPAAAPSSPPVPAANGGDRRKAPVSAEPSAADGVSNRPLSPAVRRVVAEEGVDVARVAATGPGGRITKGDVLTYLEAPQPAIAPAAAPVKVDTPAPAPPVPARPARAERLLEKLASE